MRHLPEFTLSGVVVLMLALLSTGSDLRAGCPVARGSGLDSCSSCVSCTTGETECSSCFAIGCVESKSCCCDTFLKKCSLAETASCSRSTWYNKCANVAVDSVGCCPCPSGLGTCDRVF